MTKSIRGDLWHSCL